MKKKRKEKEKYGNYLLGSPLFFFCLSFRLRKRPNLTVELDSSAFFAQRIVHAVTDLLSFNLNSFQPSPPPLPSLSLCLNSPSYESHRTIFTGLGAKSQVMTGYLPLPKPWTLKLTKICIFFDEMIHSFTCTFFAPVCYHMVWD